MTSLTRPEPRDLAEANTVAEVKDIRDRAVALEAYARKAKDPAPMNQAVETRLHSERKAGVMLREMGERRGGDQTSPERSLPSNEALADLRQLEHAHSAQGIDMIAGGG